VNIASGLERRPLSCYKSSMSKTIEQWLLFAQGDWARCDLDKEVAGSRRLAKTVLSASGDCKNVVGKLDDRHDRQVLVDACKRGARPRS
jgi:hypothetical protein